MMNDRDYLNLSHGHTGSCEHVLSAGALGCSCQDQPEPQHEFLVQLKVIDTPITMFDYTKVLNSTFEYDKAKEYFLVRREQLAVIKLGAPEGGRTWLQVVHLVADLQMSVVVPMSSNWYWDDEQKRVVAQCSQCGKADMASAYYEAQELPVPQCCDFNIPF